MRDVGTDAGTDVNVLHERQRRRMLGVLRGRRGTARSTVAVGRSLTYGAAGTAGSALSYVVKVASIRARDGSAIAGTCVSASGSSNGACAASGSGYQVTLIRHRSAPELFVVPQDS